MAVIARADCAGSAGQIGRGARSWQLGGKAGRLGAGAQLATGWEGGQAGIGTRKATEALAESSIQISPP